MTYVEINDNQERYCITAAEALCRMEDGNGWAEFAFDSDDIADDIIADVTPAFCLTLRPDWGGMWELTDADGIPCRRCELEERA